MAGLLKSKSRTWKGWAVYHWDMCHSVALFNKKPSCDEIGHDFREAIEEISVDFLAACGIDVPFDSHDFYYGNDTVCGEHPPIAITLVLPEALLDQLGLDKQ